MTSNRRGQIISIVLVLVTVMSLLSSVSFAEGDVDACSHSSTYKEWSGCDWSEYCSDCGALIRTGTTHTYEYTPWEYRTVNSHMRKGTCTVCGATTTASGNHRRKTVYEEYDESQHTTYIYCTICSSVIGDVTYEDHTLTYGDWTVFSDEHTCLKFSQELVGISSNITES